MQGARWSRCRVGFRDRRPNDSPVLTWERRRAILKEKKTWYREDKIKRWFSRELRRRGVRLVSRGRHGKKKQEARVAKSKMKVDGEPDEDGGQHQAPAS
ncbi:uncharacterized protein TrAtP1_001862 [Trichoderma atroviride]|uniref:uncharacterized protein n=1 Tax=Hypocrea atroviridis TaxID=63577 RepID=UPI0033305114|nr:hypothetical protein TrAtP1_001862 [Trichoderma atroviride]